MSKFKKFVKDEQIIVHLELKHAVNALTARLKEEDEASEALMQEVLSLVKPMVDKAEGMIMEWRNKLRPKVKEVYLPFPLFLLLCHPQPRKAHK